MAPDYLRPERLEDALAAAAAGPVRIAAGCTDLFPATERPALEMAADTPVLDITAIPALRGLRSGPDGLRLGATTTWSTIVQAELPPSLRGLQQAAREVGSEQIQNAGTLAGNLCNASPAADGVPPLLTLAAEVELASLRGVRRLPLRAFLTGPRQTARQADELMTAIHIPAAALAGRSAFLKLGARTSLVISIAMVAVRVVEEAGHVAEAAVSVGSCSAVAARLGALEAALLGAPIADMPARASDGVVTQALAPISDIRADAPYRATAAAVLVRRALATLAPAGRAAA
ncbi:MAG: FAD binding domain-containing protein [Pseudomonadota bacterium]